MLDPWFGKGAVLLAAAAMVAIRAPHGERSRSVPVRRSLRDARERGVLGVALLCFLLPFVWAFTPWLSFAEFPLHGAPWAVGVALLAGGLWIFHRSHVDLGRNWSITLEMREGHSLVTAGIYRRVRHPMYLGLLVYGLGQTLVLSNAVAGPSYLVAMLLLVALRLGPEERMLREEFGEAWDAYARGTARLVPGVW